MTLLEFQRFVADHIDWFRGRLPETESSLREFEQALGVNLPASVKWLLKEQGYWRASGVSSLEEAVRDTVLARAHLDLPMRYIVLDNFDDGGVVLVDTGDETSDGEFALYWIAPEDIGNPPRLDGNTRYESFGDYVKDRLPSVQRIVAAEDARYDPAEFPQGRDSD